MIPAICIGRGGSKGFPGKNSYKLIGYPILCYPLKAALESKYVDKVFFSSEDADLKKIAYMEEPTEINIIDRPKELATDKALADYVFIHAYNWIKNKYLEPIEFVVLLFANAPCILHEMIDEMIDILRNDTEYFYTSICTISKYNMFSPNRIRVKPYIGNKLVNKDSIKNFLLQSEMVGNCDRNSSGDFYIYDCSCAVVRTSCLENVEKGLLPQRWLGNTILGYDKYREVPALDIDYEYQLGQIEMWLKKYWYGEL